MLGRLQVGALFTMAEKKLMIHVTLLLILGLAVQNVESLVIVLNPVRCCRVQGASAEKRIQCILYNFSVKENVDKLVDLSIK